MIRITLVRDGLDSTDEKTVELEEGSTVEELLEQEDIESEEVLVSLDGAIVSGKHGLEDGDNLTVRDVIAGG